MRFPCGVPNGIDQESVSGYDIHIVSTATSGKEMPLLAFGLISLRIRLQDSRRIVSRIHRYGVKIHHAVSGETVSHAVHRVVHVFAERGTTGVEKIDHRYGGIISQYGGGLPLLVDQREGRYLME